MADGRRTFHTLDGMRGIAAILVVTRHEVAAFAPMRFPYSFLAVDLFYVLSGFVIASAYDRRLASAALSPLRFMLIRYIRLWPIYALGTAMGLAILHNQISTNHLAMDWPVFWQMSIFAMVMLPSPVTGGLYPGSAVAWSLGYEMLANILYALTFKWLSTKVLVVIAAISVVGIIAATQSRASLDNGWDWRTSWVGLARVFYSFPVGLLLYRHRASIPALRVPALVVLALLTLVLTISLPVFTSLYQVLVILFGFPLLVAAAMQVEPPRRLVPVLSLLGVTSYAIYMIHKPILMMFGWTSARMGVNFDLYGPWSGLGALLVIVVAAWLADTFYDRPIRAALTRGLDRLWPARPR